MIRVEEDKIPLKIPVIATIGFFDGVHLGHRFLINQLKKEGEKRHLHTMVVTFIRHPREVLQSDYQPYLLQTFEERMEGLSSTNIDYCAPLNFTRELASYSAERFIKEVLVKNLNVKCLLIGYDHRFGNNRSEGFEDYVRYGKSVGMEVVKVLPMPSTGAVDPSSSEVRRLLKLGRIVEANELLCFPYNIQGKVVKGERIGRTLGFPTANIELGDAHKLLPVKGIYAVEIAIADRTYKGMLYIGKRPTLKGHEVRIEVNIFDYEGDLYGKCLRIFFYSFIREDKCFENLEDLTRQLVRDRELTCRYFDTHNIAKR